MPENPVLQGKVAAEFIQTWFDELSAHRPVERMLEFVVDEGLEMVFPERTLRGHADFREWYGVVGDSFNHQTHDLEELKTRDDGDTVDVVLTVLWRARQTLDDTQLAFRANQTWTIARDARTKELRILTYRVGDLSPI